MGGTRTKTETFHRVNRWPSGPEVSMPPVHHRANSIARRATLTAIASQVFCEDLYQLS